AVHRRRGDLPSRPGSCAGRIKRAVPGWARLAYTTDRLGPRRSLMTAPGKAGPHPVDEGLVHVVDALAFEEAPHLGRGRVGRQGLAHGVGRADELLARGERLVRMGVPVGVRPGVHGFATLGIR